MFEMLDINNNGYVDSTELRDLGRALSENWDYKQNDQLMKLMDMDGDGKLHGKEFRCDPFHRPPPHCAAFFPHSGHCAERSSSRCCSRPSIDWIAMATVRFFAP